MSEIMETEAWYALRVTYSRELIVKQLLDAAGIDNFLPMHYEYVMKRGQRVRQLVPAVHNLLFAHTTREKLDAFKSTPGMDTTVRYIMDRETRQPIIVPDIQMHSFILVASTYEEAVLYMHPEELHIAKGTKVRITSGVFCGAIGEFVRIRHDRRVVVNIEGVMAVATTFVHPAMVEAIE